MAHTPAQVLSLRQRDFGARQLKAFQIVRSEPGEIREVDMEIPLDDPPCTTTNTGHA